jgi:hypothetical protein
MIVVRDVFRLKFGQAKAATDLWKRAVAALGKAGYGKPARLLTDVAGAPYYTIVLESTYDSLGQWEQAHVAAKDNAEWRDLYRQILPLTEEGHREIYSVIE